MTGQEIIISGVMMTTFSLIGHKFKIGENAGKRFEDLELDWIAGTGLAFCIVIFPITVLAVMYHFGCLPSPPTP